MVTKRRIRFGDAWSVKMPKDCNESDPSEQLKTWSLARSLKLVVAANHFIAV